MRLIKGYKAEAEIDGYTIVRFGTNDNQVITGTVKTQRVFGVVGQRGALAGEHISVTELGEEYVRIGAAVAAGQRFTTDGSGRAVPATATAGQDVNVVGIIKESSTDVGAIVRCTVCPSSILG